MHISDWSSDVCSSDLPESSVAAIARARGVEPAEIALDMLLERGGGEMIFMPAFNYAAGDLSDVGKMLAHPNTILGLSDGGTHCGQLGRASCRDSVCLAGYITVVRESLKKKSKQ